MREYLDSLDPDGDGFWNLKIDVPTYAVLAAAAYVVYLQHDALRHALMILDWFNIILHEAGHPIFSMLSLGNRWIMFAGGTAMQLLWPIGCYFVFLKQSNPKSADFCIFWFGSNFLGIGPYMADARAQVLPLIGGGEHDWTYLLDSVGLLRYDVRLGAAATYFGCCAMVFSVFTLYAHLRRSKTRAGASPGVFP